MPSGTIISFKNFRKEYKDLTAVKGLDLDIKKGEFFGLLGPNGAGKTTTISALVGLVKLTSGSITVKGHDSVKDYKKVHALIGLAPQEENLDFWFLNVREILVYHAGYFGIPQKEAGKKADDLLKMMDLWEKRSSKVMELSGGMKRRLLLARAMMHGPEIIVMDEPTAGADVELRRKLWKYIKLLNREGKTIILTTHYLEEAETLCDRVAIMNKGEIVAMGTPEELKENTKIKGMAAGKGRLEDVYMNLIREEES
ncbi:MAG: ABC transporter ATP-binding protein [Candidatus Aenigmarchaeota archaeon]|nr:ABC transporter ATP-binding protein [Candidatus Aenigmarchaeota archaeon]